MTIYLDVVWLLNLLIDFMLLKLTSIALKRPVKTWRLIVGTFFASLIVLILFTPLSPFVYHPLGKLLYSIAIVWIVFGYQRFSLFIQSFLMFYFVAFMVGGGLFAAHFFLQSNQSYDDWLSLSTGHFGDPLTWLFILIGFPIMWYFSKKRLDHVVVRKWQYDLRMPVTIAIGSCEIHAIGMVDTGNKLNHPVGEAPVMFLSQEAAMGLVPDVLFTEDPLQVIAESTLPDPWRHRLSLVPFRGVDGASRMALAFRPDSVMIHHPSGSLVNTKVFVALSDHRLSEEGDFNCILHPDMIQKGRVTKPAS